MIDKGDLKMRKHEKFLIVVLIIFIIILGACGNSLAESNPGKDNQQSDSSSDQDINEESSNIETENEEEKNTNRNASLSTDKAPINDKEDTINTDKSSNNQLSKATNKNGEITGNNKVQFLQKLHDTKNVTEELKALDSSTYALKKVENDRLVIWDEVLNEIYGALKEQLLPVEMEVLREEQRNWIKFRDESALQESLKFKGGTQEHLEYVAVLANLTEERCHELVENYMK